MPTAYIKKLNREGKGSISSLEKKWEKAKEIADKEDQKDNYAFITSIFKNMVGVNESNNISLAKQFILKCSKLNESSNILAQKNKKNYNHGGIASLGTPGFVGQSAVPGATGISGK